MQITSRSSPRVKAVMRWRRPAAAREAGVFLCEGRREVERAVAAGLTPRALWTGPAAEVPRFASPTRAGPTPAGFENAERYEASAEVMERLLAFQKPAGPDGLLAVFERRSWADADLRWGDRRLVLVAEGVEKPGNLGAMVRTAAGLGFDALVTVDVCGDLWSPPAIRNSTGAVFELPSLGFPDAAAAGTWLRACGLRIAATVLGPEPVVSLADADLSGDLAVVIGSEASGLSPWWQANADVRIRIPMAAGGVDSLNAGVAAGIVGYVASAAGGEAGGANGGANGGA